MAGAMTIEEYRRAQADRAAVQYLLDRLPASRVIERRGLEFRRRKAEEVLAAGPPMPGPKSMRRIGGSGKRLP